jgi:hypothetical protein
MEPIVDLQCIVSDLGWVRCSRWCVVVEWEISYALHYGVTTTKHVPILVHCTNDKYIVILIWF